MSASSGAGGNRSALPSADQIAWEVVHGRAIAEQLRNRLAHVVSAEVGGHVLAWVDGRWVASDPYGPAALADGVSAVKDMLDQGVVGSFVALADSGVDVPSSAVGPFVEVAAHVMRLPMDDRVEQLVFWLRVAGLVVGVIAGVPLDKIESFRAIVCGAIFDVVGDIVGSPNSHVGPDAGRVANRASEIANQHSAGASDGGAGY